MRTNSVPVTLPIVASMPDAASKAIDVGPGYNGFSVQFEDVAAATGVTYALEGSLDGENWFDLTNCLRDLGNGGGAVSAPIVTDSAFDYPSRFPGSVRLTCKHAPNAAPGTPPAAVVAFQDTTID
jgi:hypothetical protein